jgi:hypothetical protein
MQSVKQFVGILVLLTVITATGYVGLKLHSGHTKRGRVDQNLVKELTRLEQEQRNSADSGNVTIP